MTSMFKTLYKPPPSMSSRNCSKIWLECPMKSERMGERKGGGGHSHTPTEWWILFGLCLPSLNLAVSVCYVGFYGEKHGTCQTLSPTRNNEKNVCRDEERGGNVVMVKGRGGQYQEFRGCGIIEQDITQDVISAADSSNEVKTELQNALTADQSCKLSAVSRDYS